MADDRRNRVSFQRYLARVGKTPGEIAAALDIGVVVFNHYEHATPRWLRYALIGLAVREFGMDVTELDPLL